MTPSYLQAIQTGLLSHNLDESQQLLNPCTLCPRQCRVNRLVDERGFCRTGRLAEVASYGPHFGEESVLVGSGGSGTIFFCGCNLLCSFCQNYAISHGEDLDCRAVSDHELAAIMVELQEMGCHNINLVTPTHVVPQILAALPLAVAAGLRIPLVYNCGGYERVETLRLLDGIIDIYMPDMKFWLAESALCSARAADYPDKMRQAVREMQRQVGDLLVASSGLAERGLLVRHLLMPDALAEARAIFQFLVEEISVNCYLNIMDQYRPCGEMVGRDNSPATITPAVYAAALQAAEKAGLSRLDRRDTAALLRRLFSR
jgi:putative pyruvate formate lyase activating enzyme